MGLDLWFREDVIRILMATQETMRALSRALSSAGSEAGDSYQQGFKDALGSVAVAFGVAPPGGENTHLRTRLPDEAQFVEGEVLVTAVSRLDWPE